MLAYRIVVRAKCCTLSKITFFIWYTPRFFGVFKCRLIAHALYPGRRLFVVLATGT